jgi:hypothetical protein
MRKKLAKIIEKWPDSWHFVEEDIVFGQKLVKEIEPFIDFLIERGLTEKTIKRHIDNLWLLGGEIIRDIAMDEEYDADPLETLKNSVELEGGLYCRHIYTDAEQTSYDSTCRKLHKYLENN